MKRLSLLIVLCMLLATGFSMAESRAPKALTVMVYMCGSNLETLSGSATADIGEMLGSDFDTDRVNLVVMAGAPGAGTRTCAPANRAPSSSSGREAR